MTNKDFFFCYNPKLFKYLTLERKIPFITTAKNIKDDSIFTLFYKDDVLSQAIKEYNNLK